MLRRVSGKNTFRKKTTSCTSLKIFNKLNEDKYRKPVGFESLSDEEALSKGSQLGPCLRSDVIQSLIARNRKKAQDSVLSFGIAESALPPLASLFIQARGDYYETFKGNALEGLDVELYKVKLGKSGNIETYDFACVGDEKCAGSPDFANGGSAIGAASNQFYKKLLDPQQISSLSLS